MTTIITQ